MRSMLDNTLRRRLVTIPALFIGLVVITLGLPVILLLAALVDLIRWVLRRTPAMTLRLVGFGWGYLVGEAWAVIALALAGMLPRMSSIDWSYRLQRAWLAWNFNLLRLVFGLHFVAVGESEIPPGPILLLSRHVSMIDTMLPGRYVVGPHRIRLRYVLKRELLMDPALDVGGSRMPNHFIDREGDTDTELAAIRELASTIAADEGVLIYPEGTRYTEDKRVRYTQDLAARGRVGEIASGFRRVLPPRPAGTLALLDASTADVVILAHRGLEGFARVADIWSGGLVGSQIDLRFWRILRSDIPHDRAERLEWLFEVWADIDAWVTGGRVPDG
jgi:1-acyl-sn-glycerol-3-phosphate acyltransferase